jgi:hypothetical protein
MQLLHESGYSERLARSIHSNLGEELEKRVGGSDIRITEDMYLDRITYWDYHVGDSLRETLEEVNVLLDTIPSRTRGMCMWTVKFFRKHSYNEKTLERLFFVSFAV